MPEDDKNKPQLKPNEANEAELKSGALDSHPLPGPVPEIEQEPQTMAAHRTTPAQATAPAGAFANAQNTTSGGSKGNKKMLIIGGIVAGLVALLVGSGVLAYFVYQNPDKVVADSFVNLFGAQPGTAKATIGAENNEAKMNFTLDAKSNDKMSTGTLKADVTMKQQDLSLSGTVDFTATADGNGYIKLNDVDKLADKVVDAMIDAQAEQYKAFGLDITEAEIKAQKTQTLAQLKPLIDKINNRWIKFDTKANDDVSEQQKCLTDAVKKLQSDKTMRDEFGKAYADNRFVTIKEELGLKDGSYGYVLDFDTTKAESFGKAAEKTSFFKELEKCDGFDPSSSTGSTAPDDSIEKLRIELWVTQWSHQITRVKIEGTDTSSSASNSTKVMFDISLGYDKVDGLNEPKDSVDFKELEKELQQLNPAGASTTTTASPLSI